MIAITSDAAAFWFEGYHAGQLDAYLWLRGQLAPDEYEMAPLANGYPFAMWALGHNLAIAGALCHAFRLGDRYGCWNCAIVRSSISPWWPNTKGAQAECR